jgi:E3 ubiquitin-protein ligase TRIP12
MDLSLDNSQHDLPLDDHPATDTARTLRSSTRAKAPKHKDNIIPDQTSSESSSRHTRSNILPIPPKRTRDTKGKAKSQETSEDSRSKKYPFTPIPSPLSLTPLHRARRTTYPPALTINEPTRDTKGKKRAAPEAPSDDLSASAPAASSKRPRSATTAYALRPRSDAIQSSEMPKKMR